MTGYSRIMRASAVLLACVLLRAFAHAQESFPSAAFRPLSDAAQATLYSLGEPYDDRASRESFHAYPILGKIILAGDEARIATGAFRDAAAGSRAGLSLCFEPHHGLRITAGRHVYDYLLCYTCRGLEAFEDDKSIALVVNRVGSPETLNALLISHQIAISPHATTEYVESERKKELELEQQIAVEEQKWTDAMPDSLRPLWPEMRGGPSFDPAILASCRDALGKEFPDTETRILALFSWNGSGTRSWTEFLSYEERAEVLLLDFSTAELVAAAERPGLTERQLEGAARLFSGSGFSRRAGDQKVLPAALKQALLEHVRRTAGADTEKLAWAEKAFSN